MDYTTWRQTNNFIRFIVVGYPFLIKKTYSNFELLIVLAMYVSLPQAPDRGQIE